MRKDRIMQIVRLVSMVLLVTVFAFGQNVVTVRDGSGAAGTTNNVVEISLENPFISVGAIELYVRDEPDRLTATDVRPVGRAVGFFPVFEEQGGERTAYGAVCHRALRNSPRA